MLEIRNLKRSFNTQRVLKGVNLTIPPGEITVIIGTSGCGKSVMLKHIIGLLKPDSGQILLDGVDMVPMNKDEIKNARMRFGMLFQDAALFDSMNVYENIAFPLHEHRGHLKEKEVGEIVHQMLQQVGMPGIEKKMPNELSGGMRKRVGLARALVLNPEIMLYDEPTTGLDPILSKAIDELIVETHRIIKGTTIIISHDIRATIRIANHVAMLHDGSIIAYGTPEELLEHENPIVRNFLETGLPMRTRH